MKVFLELDSKGYVEGWGSSPISENNVEIELENNHPFFNSPNLFVYDKGTLKKDENQELRIAKDEKDRELNETCHEEIQAGFYYEINGTNYHFSYDTEAQINLSDAIMAMNIGMVNEMRWTVSKNGEHTRITITKEDMNGLATAILNHKNSKVSKYRDELVPLIEQATTIKEVENITWDSVEDE